MSCQRCGRDLTGRQRKWCSDACRSGGRRPTGQRIPVDESPRDRFLARFEGITFQPWERVLVDQAADTYVMVEALEAVDDPSLSVVRELRQQRLALRALLAGVQWPEAFEATEGSEWGRAMARRRWKGRG